MVLYINEPITHLSEAVENANWRSDLCSKYMRQEKVDATSFHFAPLTHTYRTQCRYHGNRYRHQDDENRKANTSVALFKQETNHMFTYFEGNIPQAAIFLGGGGRRKGYYWYMTLYSPPSNRFSRRWRHRRCWSYMTWRRRPTFRTTPVQR